VNGCFHSPSVGCFCVNCELNSTVYSQKRLACRSIARAAASNPQLGAVYWFLRNSCAFDAYCPGDTTRPGDAPLSCIELERLTDVRSGTAIREKTSDGRNNCRNM
jgi:hypothetical protein